MKLVRKSILRSLTFKRDFTVILMLKKIYRDLYIKQRLDRKPPATEVVGSLLRLANLMTGSQLEAHYQSIRGSMQPKKQG